MSELDEIIAAENLIAAPDAGLAFAIACPVCRARVEHPCAKDGRPMSLFVHRARRVASELHFSF